MMTKPTYQSNRDKMIQLRSKNRLKSREEVGLGKNVKLSDNDKKDTSKGKSETVKVTPFKDTSMGKDEKVKVTPFKDTSMGKDEKVKVTPFKDTSMGKNTDSANKPALEPKVKPTYQSNRDKMIQLRSKNRLKSREEVGLGNNVKLSDKNKKIDTSFDTTKIIDKVKAKAKADKEIDSQVDKYVEKRKVPINKDLTIDKSAEGKAKYKILKKEIEPEVKKPEVSTMTKQGEPRTKAQMMAAKRIADGKTISDVKAENEASMRAKAAERNQKFQAAKKSGNLAQFRKDNPKMSGADRAKAMAKARLAKKAAMEEYTPYDFVLEYLLSTEQVATIEEANYVMTEMDAETIQSIVEMEVNRADIIGGTKAAKDAAAGKGKGLYTPGKGVTKDFKLDPAFKLPKA